MSKQKVSDPGKIKQEVNLDGEAFRVSLRDNKPLVIKASNSWEAVERYKNACGIISTDNQFEVEPVNDPEALDIPLRGYTLAGFNDCLPQPVEKNLGVLGV